MSDSPPLPPWAASAGGPLLLLGRSRLPDWSGIHVPIGRNVEASFRWDDPEGPACDYDRACEILDLLGLIDVGEAEALVLGEEPMMTAWWPDGAGGGVLARLRSAEGGEEAVAEAIRSLIATLPDDAWRLDLPAFDPGEDALVLFDSACPGEEAEATEGWHSTLLAGGLPVEVGGRPLRLETAEPVHPMVGLVLHRLRPVRP